MTKKKKKPRKNTKRSFQEKFKQEKAKKTEQARKRRKKKPPSSIRKPLPIGTNEKGEVVCPVCGGRNMINYDYNSVADKPGYLYFNKKCHDCGNYCQRIVHVGDI